LKVLLTGASGFVGSHILDSLRERNLATAILVRNSSSTRFFAQHLPTAEVRYGSIEEPASLASALRDITHVIHCAGLTKALTISELSRINEQGTRNVVEAVNNQKANVQQLVHISSLAVTGPATEEDPADEETPLNPVSGYGRSKLAAESALRENCHVPYTILRPPAIYGPRDYGFLSMFKAVRNHLLPCPSKSQSLSLVYVKDLAEVVVGCLAQRITEGQTYFVASPEIVTGRLMAEEIARQMGRWAMSFPVPGPVLFAVCLVQEALARLTRKPRLLNLQKYAELCAPGWVCSPSKLLKETGLSCQTSLNSGIAQTVQWYTSEHWL
jgi:nucleoside-diphosphate-sugar epimerase